MEQQLNDLYDKDFYEWSIHNAELLRQGKISDIDIENIAEELESMGKTEKRALKSHLTVLIMHLLKWQYQKGRRGNSWLETIMNQRTEIVLLLQDSPSLKYNIEERLEESYQLAQKKFEVETGISKDNLPKKCSYTFDQIINDDFFPV